MVVVLVCVLLTQSLFPLSDAPYILVVASGSVNLILQWSLPVFCTLPPASCTRHISINLDPQP